MSSLYITTSFDDDDGCFLLLMDNDAGGWPLLGLSCFGYNCTIKGSSDSSDEDGVGGIWQQRSYNMEARPDKKQGTEVIDTLGCKIVIQYCSW